jgi:hypothetical protein
VAAPTVVTKGAIAALASGNISPTIPAHVADDWLFVLAWKRSATGNLSEGSGTWQTFAPIIRTGASQSQLFSKKAAGAGETITVTQNTAVNIYARAIVVRGADPNGGPNGFGFEAYDGNTSTADPSVFNGVTTLGIDRLILALISGEDDNNASTTVTATDPSAFTESYVESNVGTDACFEFSDAVRATEHRAGRGCADRGRPGRRARAARASHQERAVPASSARAP